MGSRTLLETRHSKPDVSRLCRSVGFLPSPVRAVLPPEGPLLFGSKLHRPDEPRQPPAAPSALPQGGDPGAAAGHAPLHRSGPVSGAALRPAAVWVPASDLVSALRSPVDGRLFLAYPRDSDALPQAFDKLQLFEDGGSDLVSVISGEPSLPLFYFLIQHFLDLLIQQTGLNWTMFSLSCLKLVV